MFNNKINLDLTSPHKSDQGRLSETIVTIAQGRDMQSVSSTFLLNTYLWWKFSVNTL